MSFILRLSRYSSAIHCCRYFYHGYVTVDAGNAEGVVEVARFFHIKWLIDIARHYLACHLCWENYSLVLHLADQYVLGDVRAAVLSYVGNAFMQMSSRPKFLRLQFEALHDLLADDWFIAATEWEILRSVLRWLQHDPAERSVHCVPLLQLIRFPLLEPSELDSLGSDVTEIDELVELIAEARHYHSIPSQRCLYPSSHTAARGSLPYLVLYSGMDNSNVVEYRPLVADPSADIIREEVNTEFLVTALEFAAVAVFGDCLFVAGGYSQKHWCSSAAFYCYSPHRRCWTELSVMRDPRVSHALCSADTFGLYAVAGINHLVDELGFDREVYLDTVELYDPRDNLWHDAPRLPFAVFNAGVAFCGGRLYVTGGISDNPELTVPVPHVQSCRPTDDGWTILSDMQHERHSHSVISLNDKLYVFGGLTADPDDTMGFVNQLETEVYDPAADQWTSLLPVPADFGRILSLSVTVGEQIILLSSFGKEYFSLREFDEETGSITEGQPCGSFIHKVAVYEASFPSRKLQELISSPA